MEREELVLRSKKQILFNNFLGGVAWALGVTVGLALIVAILGFILKNVNLIPYVGNFVAGVIEFILTKNPNLLTK
ncbi:DUF5665 domain-containing protein [Patescibacteria group bacterium]|nr:DUF5665 domain-containing protein [Patescibacteria group bacterium]